MGGYLVNIILFSNLLRDYRINNPPILFSFFFWEIVEFFCFNYFKTFKEQTIFTEKLVKESQLNINDYLNSFNLFLKTRINVSKVVLWFSKNCGFSNQITSLWISGEPSTLLYIIMLSGY
jgi:hypothetical protein